MLRRSNRFWALLALLMSGQALALGLGEIRLESALNEPLRAEIRLLSATPEELDYLTVQMASSETFARYGLDRPGYLSSVDFRVIRSGQLDGNVIAVTSTQPMTEPFLTFLVEASWQRGRLLREYTVLLDPPTFAPPPAAPVTESVQPPVRSQPADSGEIQRPAREPAPVTTTPVTEPPVSSPMTPTPIPPPAPDDGMASSEASTDTDTQEAFEGFEPLPGGEYQVQRGDTLWSIASLYRPDNRLTINQTMLAIFESNPEAFSGNINSMSAGASLTIPSADEVFRITRADALAEVQRQNSAWSGGVVETAAGTLPPVTQPSLELVPPDEDSLSGDSFDVGEAPDAAEVAEAVDPETLRITEIENLIQDQQDGIIVISDNELAALRRELAELRGEELPPEPEVPAEAEVLAEDEVFVADETDPSDEPEVSTEEVDAAVAETGETAEISPEPEAAPPPAPSAPEPSIVDKILGYVLGLWGLVGLAIVLVIAGLLFFVTRSSRSADEDDFAPANDATGQWSALDDGDFGEATIAEEAPSDQTEQIEAMARDGETTIVVEEANRLSGDATGISPTLEIPSAPDPEPFVEDREFVEDTAESPSLDDTFSSETALNLDQSDPIAEADFHMAYGLYDQAAELIVGALEVDQDRTDYLAKLCEIYFVWGNRDAFVDAAEKFRSVLGDGEDPEWDKTVIMGQQIAGDHPLFGDAPAATKAVDLAFDDDAGGSELDMDLAADGLEGGDDLIDLGQEDPVSASIGEDNTSVDFAFDEDSDDTGATAATEMMPAADAPSVEFGDEAKTAEMPSMDAPKEEMPTIENSTAEMETMEAPTAEMPTMEAPTADMPTMEEPTAEMPAFDDDQGSTAESPAVEDFLDVDATGAMPRIGADDATALASVEDLPDADSTSEIDLDDLGLDLDALDSDLASVNDDLAHLDDATQDMPMADDVLAATGRNEALDLPDDDETGESLLDATGQTQVLPGDFAVETGTGTNIEKALAEEDIPFGGDAETLLASLDEDDDEFDFAKTEALPEDMDLDDLTAALEVGVSDDATIDQPVDRSQLDAMDDDATAEFPPDDLSDELSDARTMTEVGTKLDLARAYVDMGDPGGAKSILEEVLDEGDNAQRQQAQQLLDSLPG